MLTFAVDSPPKNSTHRDTAGKVQVPLNLCRFNLSPPEKNFGKLTYKPKKKKNFEVLFSLDDDDDMKALVVVMGGRMPVVSTLARTKTTLR